MTHDPAKAANYIHLLDEARYDGNWEGVPELIRKVRKHAPNRACLTTTAECEYAITRRLKANPSSPHLSQSRPSTANNATSDGISQYTAQLSELIEKEPRNSQDRFQAQVCLAWAYWFLGEPSLAASTLPVNIEQDYAQLDGNEKDTTHWTKICALKAAYIKGSAQRRAGSVAEAIKTLETALLILHNDSGASRGGAEIRLWSELTLTEFCLTASQCVKSNKITETESLSAYRAWAQFWDEQGTKPPGGRALGAEVPRRQLWKDYYDFLSEITQRDLPLFTTPIAPEDQQGSTRVQQRLELKRAESVYESLVLSEVSFPKAEEVGEEVEAFVELVMQNWRVLCGSAWKEEELGEGGTEALSRGVLAVLYRAATRTFHSTAVLRNLFTVHLAVADFDLALKAFDTYLEIVKKGKARIEKTGEPEPGLDDDEAVLRTAAECIRALCQFGDLDGAKKAREIAHFFEDWLDAHHPTNTEETTNGRTLEDNDRPDIGTMISPRTFAMAWRCIGIAHANWARLTFDASSRADIQMQAIQCFRKALATKYQSTDNVETLFALGVILAERRELSAAIDVVKAALMPPRPSDASQGNGFGPQAGRFTRERSLIPLWHLLALLLSARQEFTTAARACEGAFEQFQDPVYLFGEADLGGSYQSEHLNENVQQSRGIVDEMSDLERENVLEVKMTQLALLEVLEGPDVAVNASDELLSLYARLFGDPQSAISSSSMQKPTLSLPPPQTSAGTIRSMKGSIFGRSSRRSVRRLRNTSSGASEYTVTQTRPQTMETIASGAPTIHVTNEKGENGSNTKKHLHGLLSHHGHPHNSKVEQRSASLSRKKSFESTRNKSGLSRNRARSQGPHADSETIPELPTSNPNQGQWSNDGVRASQVGVAISPEGSDLTERRNSKPLPPQTQNMTQSEKALKSGSTKQDTRVPYIPSSSGLNSKISFPKLQTSRRRSGVLVRVWLLVAAFYRRAALYDDARGAIDEASKLAQTLEDATVRDTTGNVSIRKAGWGGGKSVSELWADIYSERGYLATAEKSPYLALDNFELALTHFADHPAAIVGLSDLLLDIYTETLPPVLIAPTLDLPGPLGQPAASTTNTNLSTLDTLTNTRSLNSMPSSSLPIRPGPLGRASPPNPANLRLPVQISPSSSDTAQLDRLAARDRAYGLLSTLTKLGSGWNNSEAWFTLSRAYEEGGQQDKAREVLWWCVELEEARAVRGWDIFGGYVL